MSNKISDVPNKAQMMAHDLGQQVGASASRALEVSNEYVKTGREYVEENPMKGIAIAAITGVVVGSLLTIALRRR